MGRDRRVSARAQQPDPGCVTLRRLALGLLLALAGACDSDPPVIPARPAEAGARSQQAPKPVDRLAPGELAPGTDEAFGLTLPRVMRVEARFPRTVHAVGKASAEAVANYVRERVSVRRVELGAARTIFPQARILGAAPHRVVRIEVLTSRGRCKLVVRDVTRKAATQGLTEADRWRQAGISPEGKPLNWRDLE
jgi:hypothetical protein